MDKIIKKFISEHSNMYFDEFIVPYLRKNYKTLFPDIDKNLCLEHYNAIHQTTLTENNIKLIPTKCWACKANKDRP